MNDRYIMPEDFDSAEQEQMERARYWEHQIAEAQRPIEPREFVQTFKSNFYLNPHTRYELTEAGVALPDMQIWAEVSGPSGSGKHSIVRIAQTVMAQLTPEERLAYNDHMYSLLAVDTIKAQVAAEAGHDYEGAAQHNGILTENGYGAFIRDLREEGRTWEISTYGPLSTFNLMAYGIDKDHKIVGFVKKAGLGDVLWEQEGLGNVLANVDAGILNDGLGVLAETVTLVRQSSLYNRSPLYDSQNPLIFVSGQSLAQCERNRLVSAAREYAPARKYSQMSRDIQLQIRFVDALMLHNSPDTVIEINATQSDNFAKAEAEKVLQACFKSFAQYH